MNTKDISNVALWALNRISQTQHYKWDSDFCKKEVKEVYDELNKELSKNIDFKKLTSEDCDFLRFGKWDKNNPMRLIPLYLLDLLPKGMQVKCIDGRTLTVGKDYLDSDVRFGCTAYGIIPVDKQSK